MLGGLGAWSQLQGYGGSVFLKLHAPGSLVLQPLGILHAFLLGTQLALGAMPVLVKLT